MKAFLKSEKETLFQEIPADAPIPRVGEIVDIKRGEASVKSYRVHRVYHRHGIYTDGVHVDVELAPITSYDEA